MPIYVYACTSCKKEIEAYQKYADKPISVCNNCGGSMRKKISVPVIIYKGRGFYSTDNIGD